MNTPKLDIAIMNTYNSNVLTIADVSFYPVGYNPNNPYIEITPPSMPKITTIFTPKSVNVFNSVNLETSGDCPGPLPDGIYKIRYSIHPNYELFVERSILRIDQLLEKYDTVFLQIDITECDTTLKANYLAQLEQIEIYIQAAMASANKCNEKLAYDLFRKANRLLDKIQCYVSDMPTM